MQQQQAASKQQASNSTREMAKNQNSVVVFWIWLKFWCMIPMGVRDNDTKFEQVADLGFKNCNLGPKTAIVGPKQP